MALTMLFLTTYNLLWRFMVVQQWLITRWSLSLGFGLGALDFRWPFACSSASFSISRFSYSTTLGHSLSTDTAFMPESSITVSSSGQLTTEVSTNNACLKGRPTFSYVRSINMYEPAWIS